LAAAIAAATNDVTTQVAASSTLAQALALAGDEPGARDRISEAVSTAEQLGNPAMIAAAYTVCGEALGYLGHSGESVAMFAKGLASVQEGGPQIMTHLRTAYVLESDESDEAIRLLLIALPDAREQLSGVNQLSPLVAAAKTLARSGQPALAATLMGTVHEHGGGSRLFGTPLDAQWRDRLVEQLRRAMGDEAVNEQLQRGAALTPDQALQLAFEAVRDLAVQTDSEPSA
jgi:hypothetical protein